MSNTGRRSVMGREYKSRKSETTQIELKTAYGLVKEIQKAIRKRTFKEEKDNIQKKVQNDSYLKRNHELCRRLNRKKGMSYADMRYLKVLAEDIKEKIK